MTPRFLIACQSPRGSRPLHRDATSRERQAAFGNRFVVRNEEEPWKSRLIVEPF